MKPHNDTHRRRIGYIFIAGGQNQLNAVNRELAADFHSSLHGLQAIDLIRLLQTIADIQGAEDQAKLFLTLVLAHPDMFHRIMHDSFDQGRRLDDDKNNASYLMGATLGLMEVLDDIVAWPNYEKIRSELPKLFAGAFLEMCGIVQNQVFGSKVKGAMSNSIAIFLRHVNFWEFMTELDAHFVIESPAPRWRALRASSIEVGSLAEYILKEVMTKFAHTSSMSLMVHRLALGHAAMTAADASAS